MNRIRMFPVILLLLTLVALSMNQYQASAQSSVTLQITRVYWGQAGANPAMANPGDANIPLTVEVFNYSNETIKGMKGLLVLQAPISGPYGRYNTTVSGAPVEVGNILNQTGEVLPLGSFTLTYSLTIGEKARPGSYISNLTITYSLKVGATYHKGAPQTLSITLVVDKTPTTLTCTVSPQRIDRDESIEASGSIEPRRDNVTISLQFRDPTLTSASISTQTKIDGTYRISYKPNIVGTWSLNASWQGDETHDGSWSITTFEVTDRAQIAVHPSKNYLTADKEVALDLNLTNSGGVPLSSIDVAMTVPQPLLIYGENGWSISYLDVKNSTVIPLRLYAPSNVIGSTFTAPITFTYRDTRGGSYTQTYLLALVVRGYITMVTYDKASSPNPVAPGRTVTLGATLLNKGNINALYTNATLLPNPRLTFTAGSTSYLGQVDDNSPVPFTLTATVNSDAQDGTYPASAKITYQDDQQLEHTLVIAFEFSVATPSASSNPATGQDLLATLGGVWWIVAVMLGTTAVVLGFFWRRAWRAKK